MYIKRGKCLGVFQTRQGIKAGIFYEMIMFGNFSLVILSSDDSQNGVFMYSKNSDENFKSLAVWRKQVDGTLYIDSQNDKSFGSYIAEKIGDEYWMYDAEELKCQ
jgi:hypothetical protein